VNKLLLVSSLIALGTSAACTRSGGQIPVTTPTAAPNQPASATAPQRATYRPVHQGGIDFATALYVREDDDLFVDTSMRMVLRRTYRSRDRQSRHFGVGATHPGEWWLYGDGDPRVPWADLILADGGRIHFTRISPGNTQEGAVLRHHGTPGEFDGALLVWNGSLWEMRFRDGSLALFTDCHAKSEVCSLVERRDVQGHRIVYTRDSTGRLLSMESEGQKIAFDYDDHKRIVRAYDSSNHVMLYTYDDAGRLVRAAGSDGTVRGYTYDDRDNLIAVRDPHRIVQNWYDAADRVVRQEVRRSESDNDPYYVAKVRYTGDGESITQTEFDEGEGVRTYRFNSDRYVVSRTLQVEGRAPVTFTYDRDPTTNTLIGVTLSCLGAAGPVTRSVPSTSDRDERSQLGLMRAVCLTP
jgi:YD repeat-containing protein